MVWDAGLVLLFSGGFFFLLLLFSFVFGSDWAGMACISRTCSLGV